MEPSRAETEPQGETDRRAHPRAPASVRVAYHFGRTMGSGVASDLSEGGLFLRCADVAPAGTRIYLEVYLPGRHRPEVLEIIGLVAWVDPGEGMGVHFEVAYVSTRHLLADFMVDLIEGGRGLAQRTAVREGAAMSVPYASVRRTVTWSRTSGVLIRVLLVAAVLTVGVFAAAWFIGRMGVG
ncbi:MAG: PilZ domain-containing protein [Myxococcota bacterium]